LNKPAPYWLSHCERSDLCSPELAEVRHGLADLSDFSACERDNFFACNRGFLKIDVV
jgi:hypothetical protein